MANNITPVPPDKIGESHAWREWFSRIYMLLNGTSAGSVPINHNALTGIDGSGTNHISVIQNSLLPSGTPTSGQVPMATSGTSSVWSTLPMSNGGGIGPPGLDGFDGEDGQTIVGPRGPQGIQGQSGTNGTPGQDGEDGGDVYILLSNNTSGATSSSNTGNTDGGGASTIFLVSQVMNGGGA